jgi:hypothetical protein
MESHFQLLSAADLSRRQPAIDSPTHRSIWVQLAKLPSPLSHNQALLLAQQSPDEWRVWIPDFGETTLHQHEFYFGWEWN